MVGLSINVTSTIVAIVATSLFNEVEKGMDIITQKKGASDRALKEMQDNMKILLLPLQQTLKQQVQR